MCHDLPDDCTVAWSLLGNGEIPAWIIETAQLRVREDERDAIEQQHSAA